MPQQGPGAAFGDQSGRGARLNPVRRLTLAGAGVIAGGAVVAIGSRLAWATITIRSSPVSAPGLPRVALAGGTVTLDAAAVHAGYVFGLGLLLALVPLGWLVAGPRGRLLLGIVAFALAAIAFGQTTMRSDVLKRGREEALRETSIRSTSFRVATGSGIPVTAAGAAVAGLSALWGGTVGGKAPRLGLPEPGGGPDRNGSS
jgi:hypothetical protein